MNREISFVSRTGSSGINGDYIHVIENKLILLADGASGSGERGKVIFGEVCKSVLDDNQIENRDIEEYITDLVLIINKRLIEVSQKRNGLIYGTLSLCYIDNETLYVTSFGDSPIFLSNNTGIKQIATPKKKYESMIDAGYISKEEYQGYITNMHPMMWSCFDVFLPIIVAKVKIEKHILTSNDVLVMCCDGMSDCISKEEIFKGIRSDNLKSSLKKLVREVKEKSIKNQGYYDDISIVSLVCS